LTGQEDANGGQTVDELIDLLEAMQKRREDD
jgi:hypothetical protein